MKAPVAAKIPKRELTAKNSTSGPRSSTSLSTGLSCFFSAMVAFISGIQPNDGPCEIACSEGAEILDALADADEMHGQPELGGDRHQNAAVRGAVELGHHQARDARDFAEDLDLIERVLADGRVEHQQNGVRRQRFDLA